MRLRRHLVVAVAATVALGVSGVAAAHHPDRGRLADEFGDVAHSEGQHGPSTGHLPPKKENVALIGKAGVTPPPGVQPDMTDRVADVAAFGDYAYLTAFQADDCLGGGAWIVDISDPTNPFEIGFLPTTPGNYAGEGSQVINVEHGPFAGRQLFIHQNEILSACVPVAEASGKEVFRGGINIWDVTDPLNPVLLAEHVGDTTGPVAPNPNDSHSMFAWNSHLDEKLYVVLIDNFEFEDLDIIDITDPANAVMVNDTLDLFTLFGIGQNNPPHLAVSIFSHDMMVYRKGDRYIMNVSYWDGGYVLIDVTDPTPGNVTLVANWDFPEFDDQRLLHGEEVPPEGNGHQSEISPDFRFMIATDEDFAPFRVGEFQITTGPNAGVYPSTAVGGAAPPTALPDQRLNGPTAYVGYACPDSAPVPHRDSVGLRELAPGEEAIAVVQRGPVADPSAPEEPCFPGQKADAAIAAGYDAVLFVNHHPGELASPDSPFCGSGAFTQLVVGVCTTHTAFHHLFDSPPDLSVPYNPALEPAIGALGHDIDVSVEFDGWGYVRLFRTKLPGEVGQTGSIEQIDTYAIPEAQDEAFAIGFGDLSVHEVAMDPRPGAGLAYFSYYAGGFRVAEYDNRGIREVGAFIDEGGNNFWGVEVHKHKDGQHYVLASDRDFGLYIFQYTGKIAGGDRGASAFNPRP